MGKIKGWKKIGENSWKTDMGDAVIDIIELKNENIYDVWISPSNRRKQRIWKSVNNKKKAQAIAIKYMKSHPRG